MSFTDLMMAKPESSGDKKVFEIKALIGDGIYHGMFT